MTSFVLIDRMSNQNQQESGEACAALTIYAAKYFTGGGDSGVASKILLLRELHESELLTYPEDV